MVVTAFYAALLAPLFIVLSVRVIGIRRESGATLGDAGNAELLRRMRVHANFAEYTPMALILLALAESLQTSWWLLHGLGLALLAGRLCHAIGMSRRPEVLALRGVGMALSFAVLGIGAAVCLMQTVRAAVGA